MYEIFYVGGTVNGERPRARPVAERDNATFAQGKAELEALRAKGFGGDKPGMNLAGSEPVSLPPANDDE
jgi:hypothetical protein